MNIKGLGEYFSDKWNWSDSISYLLFLTYYFMRNINPNKPTILYLMKDYETTKDPSIHDDGVTELDKILMVLNCFIVLMALIKLCGFLRAFEST
tara:strand:- start:295 stop:576 length:282 start_codon:yes stop_codon:yes gene_type:complete